VSGAPLSVAVFASGGGSNFQALLDHQRGDGPWRIVVLVTNRAAPALDRAEAAGVQSRVIPTRDREEADIARDTLATLDEFGVDVILLSGYLRRLPPEVVAKYSGRIVNVHPALLPDFGGKGMYGMNVHRAVVASGVEVTGATVHFVTDEYDEGAILGQWQVHVAPNDTAEDVAERVLGVEHKLYPAAVDHLCRALADARPAERMKDVRLDEPPEVRRSSDTNEEAR